MKSSTELIINSTAGHLACGMRHDSQRLVLTGAVVCSQNEIGNHRKWKFWRATKTAVHGVVILDNPADAESNRSLVNKSPASVATFIRRNSPSKETAVRVTSSGCER